MAQLDQLEQQLSVVQPKMERVEELRDSYRVQATEALKLPFSYAHGSA